MALTVGSRLGHYEVSALIGEGGMGQVYQATDTKLNRQVALKILPEAFATDPDRLARFQREAQVLASLNHPGIAAIYGLEESGDTRALVLELVEGPTLADRIAQGPIPLDEALPIAKQIAEALEAAHEQGVIHRDLKPANIKVKDDGMVKVLDFGLAKAFEPEAGSVSASMSPTISLTAAATQMGMVIGTAAYMAPEQAKGLSVDKRADIWAYGAVLFEMLTGKKLFEAGDVSEMLASVLVKDPDISSIGGHVPDHVRSVVRQCLIKDPKERLRDIGDVRLAMKGTFETTASAPSEPGVGSTLPVWLRQRPITMAVSVLASLTVGGVAVWSLTRPAPPPPGLVARFSIPLAANQNFSNTGRPTVAISPDGSQVVHTANGSLWLRPVDQLQAVQVSGTEEGAIGPFFSADGQSIGFYTDGQLKRVAVSGGAPVTVADGVANTFGASWGADDMILYGQPEGIMQVPGASGTPELLISVSEGEVFYGPQMLPGGEWVLFTLRPSTAESWDEAQIVVQSLVSEERVVLIEGGRDARYLPTGHLVYALNEVLFGVAFDADALQVLSGPVPLVEGVPGATGETGAVHYGVSNSGSLAYIPGEAGSGSSSGLVWVDRNGDEEPLGLPPGSYQAPRVSPDGTRMTFASDSDSDDANVWIYEVAGTTAPRRLTFEGANRYPIWLADGERVAFQSNREGDLGIFSQRADGTGPVQRLTTPDEGVAHVPDSVSPDGETLSFTAAEREGSAVWMLALESLEATPFAVEPSTFLSQAVFSPDGQWVAYQDNESGATAAVYVQPFPATGAKYLLPDTLDDDTHHPLWSPRGDELFYVPGQGQFAVVSVTTQPGFEFGNPVSLAAPILDTGPPSDIRDSDVMPTGDRFIAASTRLGGERRINIVLNWFQELTERVPIP